MNHLSVTTVWVVTQIGSLRLQEVLATTSGWIRSICYKHPNRVGVLGSVYAADDQGSIVRLAVSTPAAGSQQ